MNCAFFAVLQKGALLPSKSLRSEGNLFQRPAVALSPPFPDRGPEHDVQRGRMPQLRSDPCRSCRHGSEGSLFPRQSCPRRVSGCVSRLQRVLCFLFRCGPLKSFRRARDLPVPLPAERPGSVRMRRVCPASALYPERRPGSYQREALSHTWPADIREDDGGSERHFQLEQRTVR